MQMAIHPNTTTQTVYGTPEPTVMLTPQDVYRIPPRYGMVRVVQGKAWLSYSGRDVIVNAGEERRLEHVDAALISMLGRITLMVELVEDQTR